MTDPALPPDERRKASGLEKAFSVFVWLFVGGVALVTVFYIVLFVMWGMST